MLPAPRGRTLITGATDGIGAALARRMDARGDALVLAGRRPRPDAPLYARHPYLRADLALPGAARSLTDQLGEGPLRGLVLNAGAGWVGLPGRQPIESVEALVAANLGANVALLRALLPRLAGGTVVVVSSIAARLPAPEYAVYAATKTALEGLVRALALEQPVTLRIVRPGPTRTGMHDKVGAASKASWPSADSVAAAIDAALTGGPAVRTVGIGNRLAVLAGSVPGMVDALLRKRAHPRVHRRGHALVTGSSAGIGEAVARRLLAEGYSVIGVDRDDHPDWPTHRVDLAGSEGRRRLLDLVGGPTHPAFDVVVHNAGVNRSGPFLDADDADPDPQIELNLVTPLALTAALIGAQRLAPAPRLVFVSSLSHFVGYPGAAVYAATKDGLTAYARSLGVAYPGIRTLTVFPGPTRTEQARSASPAGSDEAKRMPPELVADAIVRAADRGRRRVVPGLGNRVVAWFGLLFPGLAGRAMRRLIYEPLAADAQGK